MKAMSRLSGIFSATAVSLAVGILASSVVAVAPASASGIAPSAYTRGVSAVGATTAVLEGKVTDQSSSASTVTFCLSTSYTTTAGALTCSITTSTPTLATYSGSTNVTNGSQTGDLASLSVGSLTRGTAYYYQLVATNSFGTSHGKVVEVTTDNQSAYENTVSVSPPPAGSFSGSSGGDGWMLTFSSTNVFTVFHQNPSGSNELTASCHNETSTSACAGWNGVDGTGTLPIYDSAHPTASLYPSADESVYFDPTNSYLYVWAVENLSSVYTMGVIGINTLTPSGSNVVTSIDGTFIPLSGSGEATLFTSGTKRGNYSDAVMEGTDWYSFNADNTTVGAGTHGSEDALVCFDVATGAACANDSLSHSNLFDPSLGGVTVDNTAPSSKLISLNSDLILSVGTNSSTVSTCIDVSSGTPTNCAGWSPDYVSVGTKDLQNKGAPLPILNIFGTPTGFCLRGSGTAGAYTCYSSASGASVTTPSGLATLDGANNSDVKSGPAQVLGTRIYYTYTASSPTVLEVLCYDYATNAACAGSFTWTNATGTSPTNLSTGTTQFPLTYTYMSSNDYTVNYDPYHLGCLWVNADSGTQIANMDGYDTGPCGNGGDRVLVSAIVTDTQLCTPSSYASLYLISPTNYVGTITATLEDSEGIPLTDPVTGSPLPTFTLTPGTPVDLSSYSALLTAQEALPQVAVTGSAGAFTVPVDVQLTWDSSSDPSCLPPTGSSPSFLSVLYNGNTNTSGTTPVDSTQYTSGQTVTVAANTGTLALTNYTLSGWCTVQEAPGTACSGTSYASTGLDTFSITATTTLYAQWSPNPSHTVTFNNNGGTGTMVNETDNAPTALTTNTFTDPGYTFTGWNTNAGGTGTAYADGASYPFTADVTLYAQWSPNPSHTVTYDPNGGSGSPVNQTENAGADAIVQAPASPTRVGYNFIGWSTSNSATVSDTSDIVTGDLTLYAVWSVNGYTVTYDPNGGSGRPVNQTENFGTNAIAQAPTAPTRSGFNFGGWSTSNSATTGDTTDTVTGAVTLYAVWSAQLTVTSTPGGTVVVSVPLPTTGSLQSGPVNPGTRVTLTANPSSGFEVIWSGACANTAGPICVVTMSESQGVRAYFVPRLALPIFHFATNKWNVTLSPADAKRLNNDLRELSRFPQIELHLTGYADIRSTPAHNEFLARNRAASVKTYLVSLMRRLGLAPLRMVALGVGQTQKFGSKYLNDRVTTVTY